MSKSSVAIAPLESLLRGIENTANRTRDTGSRRSIKELAQGALGDLKTKMIGKAEHALVGNSDTHKYLQTQFPAIEKLRTSGIMGEERGLNEALKAYGLIAANSVKGIGGAAVDGAKKSIKRLDGIIPGSSIGSLSGAGAGAIATEGDASEKARGALLGALLGGATGGVAGVGGRSVTNGMRSGVDHFMTRAKGWDELMDIGVWPKFMTDAVFEDTMKGYAAKGGWKTALKDAWKKNDHASVIMMEPGKADAGNIFTGALGGALNKAKIRDLDAGPVINPAIAHTLLRRPTWSRLRSQVPTLDRVHGAVKGTDEGVLHLGNPQHDKSGLYEALNEFAEIASGNRYNVEKSLAQLTPEKRKMVELLEPRELQSYLNRSKLEGNVNFKHVWADGDTTLRPFDIDIKGDLKAQAKTAPKVKQNKLNPEPDWQGQLLREDGSLSREGIARGEKKLGESEIIKKLRRAMAHGEKVNVSDEFINAGAAADKQGIRGLFPNPPLFERAAEKAKKLAPEEIGRARGRRAVRDGAKAVDTSKFKQGDTWEIMGEAVREQAENGGRIDPDMFKSWDAVDDVTRAGLVEEGVTGPAEWEAFKRAVVSAYRKAAPVKSASHSRSIPSGKRLRLHFAVRKLLR